MLPSPEKGAKKRRGEVLKLKGKTLTEFIEQMTEPRENKEKFLAAVNKLRDEFPDNEKLNVKYSNENDFGAGGDSLKP